MDKLSRICTFIGEELIGEGPIEPDADLLSDELVDSMGIVVLLDFIEDELGVVVPAELVTYENFETLHVLVWQSLIIFFTVMLWILWVSTLARGHEIGYGMQQAAHIEHKIPGC